jgi:hypothetical protein
MRDGIRHYRSRCENCVRKQRHQKPRTPRWQLAGYKKKLRCDICGFRAQYAAQIGVHHMDGKLDNTDLLNLRSVCKNCEIRLRREDHPAVAGDLEPDL